MAFRRTGARGVTMWTVELVERSGELESRRDAWEALARRALEPNPFLEPDYVIAALQHLSGPGERPGVIFVWRNAGAERELAGLIAISRPPRSLRLPVRCFSSWAHQHAFLGTPLLDRRCPEDSLRALVDWARGPQRPGRLLRMERVASDGPFWRALQAAAGRDCRILTTQTQHRPLFVRPESGDFDRYYRASASGTRRRRYRGLGQQLAERGRVVYTEVTDPDACGRMMEQYLELEARGWKGRAGTAMAARPEEREFCREVMRGFATRRRFRVLALQLDGRPIAIRSSLQSGSANFCFKTSFDPEFAHYSPGVLLEIEQLRRMTCDPSLDWSDSCAASESTPLTWLWTERREIRSLLISFGDPLGALCVAVLPVMSRLGTGVRRRLRARRRGADSGDAAATGGQGPKDHP